MADTTFSNGTVIDAAWLNDVNRQTYDLPDSTSTTKGDALVAVKRTATGAVASTLHAWMEKTPFCVTDFGAVGNGSTDDTTAIQACITAAETAGLSAGGAVIYVPPASSYYKLTSPLSITKNGMTLLGGGAGSTFYNATGNCLQVGDGVTPAVDVHIVGMNLQANGTSKICLWGRSARNITIERCLIVNYGTTGDGIRLTDSFCARISHCTFGSIQGYGIHASVNANAMAITNNRLDGASSSATCGIYLDGSGNTISGNTVESWATCVNGKSWKGGVILGNYFETYTTAILFDAVGAEGIDIRGNYFAAGGPAVVSIKISAGNGFKIGPNSFVGTHSGGAPIELTSSPSGVYIEPGQVHDDGYIVKWPTTHLTLDQHLLSDNLYPAERGYLSPVTQTGSTSETTMKTYTGVKEHWGVGTRIEVQAAGRVTGTAGQKDIRLKLAGTTIGTISEAAGATSDWMFKAQIDVVSSTVAVGTVMGFEGATIDFFDNLYPAGVSIALATTNPTITLTGQLANAGDSIILDQWKVQVIN